MTPNKTARYVAVQMEQLNSLTAWVDASQVYGSSVEEANALRDHTDPDDFGRGIRLLIYLQ